MKKLILLASIFALSLCLCEAAEARVFVGVGVGGYVGGPAYYPYYAAPYPYYSPYAYAPAPYYYPAAPVAVAPAAAPVVSQNNNGQYCREYTHNAVVDGQTQKVHGTACRQPDGSWKMMN